MTRTCSNCGKRLKTKSDRPNKPGMCHPCRQSAPECMNGHPWTEASTLIDRRGYRRCLVCQTEGRFASRIRQELERHDDATLEKDWRANCARANREHVAAILRYFDRHYWSKAA